MSQARIDIKVFDMNAVLDMPEFLSQLRELSFGYGAGMNTEINRFIYIRQERLVNAKAIVGYLGETIVGWALYSKEGTRRQSFYSPEQGVLIYVYVETSYRRMKIGSTLLAKCKELAEEQKLCVCPWDEVSHQFYQQHKQYKLFSVVPEDQFDII